MANVRVSEWRKLPISLTELSLDTTLRCGQSFRWKKLRNDEWTCALHGRILSLKQDATHLHYRSTWPNSSASQITKATIKSEPFESIDDNDTESLLRHYLNLKPNLTTLYESWASADQNFKKRAPKFTGVRILQQDPWEALVGFICSSNNNIPRISQMVSNLCLHYGVLIGNVDDQALHDFPSPEALTGPGIESHLRELGFGYRAGYIAKTAAMIVNEKPKHWLESLCNDTTDDDDIKIPPGGGREGYRRAHEELLGLLGVGPKVADCVCLMGLGWGEAVPVDTHVWQIAQRDYKFGKGKHKSLTKATYDAIGDHFRQLWGLEAGWAHTVLFAADLKMFSERLIVKEDVQTEQVVIKQEESILLEDGNLQEVMIKPEENVKDEFEAIKVDNHTISEFTKVLKRKFEWLGDNKGFEDTNKPSPRSQRASKRK